MLLQWERFGSLSQLLVQPQNHIWWRIHSRCNWMKRRLQKGLPFVIIHLLLRWSLSKGEKPWKLADLKVMLYEILKFQRWKLISMGKGFFYQVFLFSVSDKQRIWSNGSLLLKPRILSLWEWTPYFNSELQHSRMCKFRWYYIWIRFTSILIF